MYSILQISGYIKCLALIAQVVRTLGMNPKVEDSSPAQVETFFCF